MVREFTVSAAFDLTGLQWSLLARRRRRVRGDRRGTGEGDLETTGDKSGVLRKTGNVNLQLIIFTFP